MFVVTTTGKTPVMQIDDISTPFILLHPSNKKDLTKLAIELNNPNLENELNTSKLLKGYIRDGSIIKYIDYDKYNNYTQNIFPEVQPITTITEIAGETGEGGGSGSILSITNIENEYVANENINQFQPVIAGGYIANSNNLAHSTKFLGISLTTTLQNFTGKVISIGEITNNAWNWIVSNPVYLNGTSLSHTPPTSGFVLEVGVAKESNSIFINPKNSIKL